MPEARERKNEARERKSSDKIKGGKSGNGAKKSPVKSDVRRQMTVKLQKEMIERRRNRDTGGSTDTTPEVQATEQVEEKVYTTVESIREHTNNAVSKSIARHRRKLQKEKDRKDQNRDEIPITDAEAEHSPSPAQQDIPRQAVGDARTQGTETRQERPASRTRPISDRVREKAAPAPTGKDRPIMPTSSPGEQMRRTMIKEKREQSKKPQQKPDTPIARQTHAPFHERDQPTIPPPAPKEKMRQTMIREKQTQRIQRKEIRQKPDMPKETQISASLSERLVPKERQSFERIHKKAGPKERRTSAPLHERTAPKEQQALAPPCGKDAPKSQQKPAPFFRRAKLYDTRAEQAPAPLKPQERMRRKAIADAQIKQARQGKDYSAGTVPHLESPPASKRVVVNTPVSPDIQSINPINPIKERSRRSFAPKERPSGGSFVPKTRQAAAASSTVKTAPPAMEAIEKKEKARPLERMRQRIRRNAQRKMLQKSTRSSKEAAGLSRRLFASVAKATSSAASSLAGFVGGSVLIPVFCLIILVAAVLASPFGILFTNEPTPDAVPLNVAVGNLNMELSNTLESLQSGDYDSIDIQGQGPDWREVVAVFAVKTAGADDGVDVAALTPDRINRLKAVFWDMCTVSSELETIDHPDSSPGDDTDDTVAEPVISNTYMDKASFNIKFPNKDVVCPKISSMKFLLNSFMIPVLPLLKWQLQIDLCKP